MIQQLFETGQILVTPGALELAEGGVNLLAYLIRHLSGDWGELDKEDKAENNFPEGVTPQEFKERMQYLIEQHPDMSKREKQETKLIELFFPEEEDHERENQVQSDIQKESFTDS